MLTTVRWWMQISMIATTRSTSFFRYWKRPSSAVQIDVDFDPVWGYPVSLYIGQDRRIADEEP